MLTREHKSIRWSVVCAVLLLPLVSCTHLYEQPVHIVKNFPARETIPMKVTLQLSDELRNAKWERKSMGDTWRIPLGEQLTRNSETVARTLFADVVVQQEAARTPDVGVDAILIPKVVFVERNVGAGVLTIALEWTLKSVQDDLIWVDTVKGEGKGGTTKQVEMLVEDVFQKSFQTIASALPIKEFAERKAKAFERR